MCPTLALDYRAFENYGKAKTSFLKEGTGVRFGSCNDDHERTLIKAFWFFWFRPSGNNAKNQNAFTCYISLLIRAKYTSLFQLFNFCVDFCIFCVSACACVSVVFFSFLFPGCVDFCFSVYVCVFIELHITA